MPLPKDNTYDETLTLKASRIAYLIRDYENFDYLGLKGANHVIQWVNQFDESDRLFLLSEFEHILPSCYLSKEDAIQGLEGMFEFFKKQLNLPSIEDLLDQSCFLSCQSAEKSQTHLLRFIDEIVKRKFNRSVSNCGRKEIKYWFYLDDVLATGGTFEQNISDSVQSYDLTKFKKEGISILAVFFFLHNWGAANVKNIFRNKLGEDFPNTIKYFRFFEIENNPNRNYYVGSQSHNHVYPIRKDQPEKVLEYLQSLTDAKNNERFAFRPEEEPNSETFFNSRDARIRYENILLLKGIDLIYQIKGTVRSNTRPLGFIYPSYKTFGLGSHTFTWRNISNTCPLVFWWDVPGSNWYPLFPVINRGQK